MSIKTQGHQHNMPRNERNPLVGNWHVGGWMVSHTGLMLDTDTMNRVGKSELD